MFKFIRSLFIVLICMSYGAAVSAQDAAILPPAKTTFFTNDGKPLTGGKVYFYVPNTSTLKNTWQDANQSVVNANPVILDASGRAIIFGDGDYRQVVRDRNNNLIWDGLTSSTGSGGSGSTTGDGDLVGTIKPWAGLIAPSQYLFAYGQEISRSTYSVLFTAVTLSTSAFCNNGSPILTGLSDTTQIPIGGAVEISCMAPGTTILSKTSNSVTTTNNSSLTTSTTAVFLPWGGGNGSTTFNLPDLRGRIIAGRDNMGGTSASRLTSTYYGTGADATGAAGGSQSKVLLQGNLPAFKPAITISDPGHTHTYVGFQIDGNQAGGGAGPRNTLVSVPSTSSSTTHIEAFFTNNLGSDTPFSIVQPSITSNYIIKVTPDTAGTTNIGVTAIQGMTGDISCGSGLLCTGNVISVTGGGGSGTVTSVALTVPASSIFGITGSPITTAGTLDITTTGNSGGVLYFNTTSTISSSAALTANLPLIGGGAGNPPTVGTRSGNTTAFVTTTGALTTGNCAKWDANGNLVDNGSSCGGGGGSPGGSNTQIQFNNVGAFGGSANLTWVSPALTIGVAGSTTGQLKLTGTTSGTITVQGQSAAGTYNWNLPTGAGSSGQVLQSGGGGATAMAWTTATYPATATGTGTILRADGTNWAATTATYPNTTTVNQILYSSSANVIAGLATANGGVLNTDSSGVPSITITPTLGVAGSSVGTLAFANITSGTIKLQPVTGALGSSVLTLPAAIDTVAVLAASQAFTNKTYNGNTWTSGTGVLTIAAGKTLTYNNSITIAGTDSTTMTFPSTNGTIAALNIASQTITGGVVVTSLSQSTGNITVDCGARPLQYITNGGAFTITAPANDGSCILLTTNNGSAGIITFSGFSVGASTGDALTTTNTNKFSIHIWRVNGTSGYRIAAHQ